MNHKTNAIVTFVNGALNGYSYTPTNIEGLIELVNQIASTSKNFLFEIKNIPQLDILGFVGDSGIAITQPEHKKGEILYVASDLIGEFSAENYIEWTDPRWELRYFFPSDLYLSKTDALIKLKFLLLGKHCSTIPIDQTFNNPGVKKSFSGEPFFGV